MQIEQISISVRIFEICKKTQIFDYETELKERYQFLGATRPKIDTPLEI